MAEYLVFLFVMGVFYFLYCLLFNNHNYWRSRNVPFVQHLPLFGSFKDCLFLKKHRNDILQEICHQFPNEPYIGCFYGTTPALVIQDPNLLKLIMIKEFYYFSGRETPDHNHKDLFTNNIIWAYGDEWKALRMNLTPLFSSMKLKNMFYLIKNSSDTLESLLSEEIKTDMNIDIRSLFSKYTMDCITACAFGLCSKTMKKDIHKNPFTTMGEKIFDISEYRAVKNIFRSMWPGMFYALGFKLLDDNVGTFFNKLISGVFKNREKTKISKNDFVDLVLTWKNNNYITGDTLSNVKTGDKKKVSIEVSEELLISQCMMFFAGGFETTASSMSYILYELAKNNTAQKKLIEEVDEYFTKHDTIEYECIDMLKFTEACIEETLRLHPVFGFITRQVMHGYTLPTGLHLKKGDRIFIPVREIQRNPDNFPEPELFRPERFLEEEKKNIKPYTYMPFGEGPRICIGMRFAKMVMYAALLKVFKNYTVELAENMPHKLTSNPKSTTFNQPIGGIHIEFIPRNG